MSVDVKEKLCPRCQTTKPVEAFSPSSTHKDGRGSWCKTCVAARHRELYREDPAWRQRCLKRTSKSNRVELERRRSDPAYRERWNLYQREYKRQRRAMDDAFLQSDRDSSRRYYAKKKQLKKEGV